tara:strand:- start:2330 stop:2497 length:168 start_codon:yes stop_codon:yes gene_type:complete
MNIPDMKFVHLDKDGKQVTEMVPYADIMTYNQKVIDDGGFPLWYGNKPYPAEFAD